MSRAVSPVNVPFPGRRTRIVSRLSKGVLLALMSFLSFTVGLPIRPADATAAGPSGTQAGSTSGLPAGLGTGLPRWVGADRVPDLSLPRTVLSSVDSLIGAGGVIQASSSNVTLYNLAIALRLLGGAVPHDELLSPDHSVLSSYSFWSVQAYIAGLWVPLIPLSNDFRVIGTNTTGTFVLRTILVGSGNYSGTLKVVYKATSKGPLKWDLDFSPSSSARYRLAYAWWNVGSIFSLSSDVKKFTTRYGRWNYTFSWADIRGFSNMTQTVLQNQFSFFLDLGVVESGSTVSVDPSIVASGLSQNGGQTVATMYGFQRKVFYEPKGGHYFAFYYDGWSVRYRYSADGVNWSPAQPMPSGWPGIDNTQVTSDFSTINLGQTVVVAAGTLKSCCLPPGSHPTTIINATVYYAVGSIAGTSISWSSVQQPKTFPFTCPSGNVGCQTEVAFISVTIAANGQLALSFDLQSFIVSSCLLCAPSATCYSDLYAIYASRLIHVDQNATCPSIGGNAFVDNLRSAIVPSDSQGQVRIVYQAYTLGGSGWIETLRSIWLNASTNSTVEQLDNRVADTDGFSLASDSDYAVHLVYLGADLNVTYAYRNVSDSKWTYSKNIFFGSAQYPTLTSDFSTNNVYTFAIKGSSIVMMERTVGGTWSSPYYAVNGRINSPAFLESNFASASSTNSSMVTLLWTEGAGPYSVLFATVPIQTVWSPYASPRDPWDGNGLAPYGQYFANLGEYVSPSTGMLTVRQTDLSVAGRGLNLEITRAYDEPYSFLGGIPYNYETYPWAPLGNGWQFNFPWMVNSPTPLYLHLWNGEGYRIPSSFWTGGTATFENHQGEHFRLVRNLDGSILLYTGSWVAYSFDPGHRLSTITDATGNNTITFRYDGTNRVSNITDTVGRLFKFYYNSGLPMLLQSINQTNTGGTGSVRGVVYTYDSNLSLVSVIDPANRVTSYSYASTSDPGVKPWLLTRITYPTQWYDSYTYAAALMGTQATSYRVSWQQVNATSGAPVRQFGYTYTQGPGDQVSNSTVAAYDGTSNRPVSFTSYAFSFAGVTWNVSDTNHNLVRGVQQRFGVHGEVPREIILVSPTQSFTNFYRYDLWGNQIYSRRAISSSPSWYHESFNAYYNNGLPPGFNAFQETFSQNQGNATDNPWNVQNGYWMVKNGVYNGTETSGQQESVFAWSDIGKGDISIQANVFIRRQVNASDQRIGLLAHYPGSGTRKWALVLHNSSTGPMVSLLDEWVAWVVEKPCISNIGGSGIVFNAWYTFSLVVIGNQAQGSVRSPAAGVSCSVSGSFSSTSSVVGSTGFGLYPGGYSALFDNVTVVPATSFATVTSFSNSFIQNGAPGSNIHGALAGIAELQNGTGSAPIETYYSYYPWGGLNQAKQLYNSPAGTQWLTKTRNYDGYGNLVSYTDPRGNQTTYAYSLTYKNAYLTSSSQTIIPGSVTVSSSYSYNFTIGTRLSSVDPNGSNTTYQYDILGRVTRVNYPNGLGFVSYAYNDQANYVDITNENGWKTRQIYDGLGRLVVVDRFSGSTSYSNETSTYNWMNRLTGKTDALGNRYLYQYDVLGRTISTVEPNGNSTLSFYNDTASWVRTADENGVYKCNVFDRLGRLISVVENSTVTCQSGIVTNYYYDEVGNLAKITTSRLQSTSYAYDNLNRLTKTSYPDGTFELFTYDNNGNLITKVDRKGVTTQYFYDSLNRVLTVNYLGTTLTSNTYNYDRNSNLVQLASQNATINYSYDARNRLLSETYSVNTGFGMSPSPSALTIEDGSSAQSTITLTSFNGFAGTLSLSASASTGYATLSLSQSAVTLSPGGTATSVLTVSMSPYGTAGLYNVTVTGTSAGVSHTIIISLTVTDFSLTVSPSSTTVSAGRQVSVTVTAQSLSGYSGLISLSVYSGLPACASSPVFTPSSLKLSASGTNSSTLTFNLAGSCSLSQYTVWVRGIDGTLLTRYALFGLTISGFIISVSPSAIGVQQGFSASITVTATSINLYSGSLQLSTLGLPAGVTSQLSPNRISLGSGSSSTSSLTLNVGSSSTSGTYPITVQATDGFMSRNSTLTLVIGSFALSVSPNPVTIPPGGKGNVTVTISQDIGASGTLTLSFSGPKCVGASFNPATISLPGGGSSTLTLSVASSCNIGSYSTTVSTGSKLPSTTLTLVVADFTISASPTSVSIAQGTGTTSTISLNSKGFTGTVGLNASVSPVVSNGPTASLFNPTLSLSAGGSNSTSLQISAFSTTPTGSYTVTVTGTSGYISHSISISVSVTTGGGGGGGGGSVAAGTLIVLADGSQVAVQNLQAGMQLLSYDTTNHRFLITTITSFVMVVTDNQMVIQTWARSPLLVDQNPAQKLYVMLPNGTQTMLSVTQLQVGYQLFIPLNQTWTPITSIQYQNGGVHVMYDIYNTAPGNYIANGYLDPVKLGPTPTSTSTSSTTSSTSTSTSSTSTAPAVGSVTYAINYAYVGELLTTMTYPDGFAISYSYDGLGRLTSVSQTGMVGYYANFTYYRNDQILRVNYGNGLAATYNYDSLSRPIQIKLVNGASTLLLLNYAYYKTGTVASITGNSTSTSGTVGVNEQYKYDSLQRLTNATVTSGVTTTTLWYEYDTVGNRLRQSQNNALLTYAYTAQNNELTSAVVPGTNTGTFYAYDPNGNLVSRNVTSTSGTVRWSYAWDPANRLVKVTSGGIVQGAYAYDGTGRRVESVEGSSSTLYAYLGTDTLYEQILGKANVRYVYAANLRIANVTGTTVSYYHTDALGSTRLMTDASGRVIFSDSYQPFGQDNGTPSGSETYKFTGKPVSQTTGLYYYYHRWYDPFIGRFISPDPKHGRLSNPQSLNLYIYVIDLPTRLTDPSGEGDSFHDRPYTPPGPGLTQAQQAQLFTVLVIVVSVVAVVATAGAAAPIVAVVLGSAIGASASTTIYTVTQGDKATLAGAVGAAATGAIAGALGGGAGAAAGLIAGSLIGSLGGTAAAIIGIGAGAVIAGAGADVGDLAGGLIESALGGRRFSVNANRLAADFILSAGTFGLGQRLGVGEAADELVAGRTASIVGDVTLDTWIPGTKSFWEAEGLKAAWEVGTNVFTGLVGGILPQTW